MRGRHDVVPVDDGGAAPEVRPVTRDLAGRSALVGQQGHPGELEDAGEAAAVDLGRRGQGPAELVVQQPEVRVLAYGRRLGDRDRRRRRRRSRGRLAQEPVADLRLP